MNTKKVWIVQLRVTDDGMNDKDILMEGEIDFRQLARKVN